MKKLLIIALALSAGLTACGDKKEDTAESGDATSQNEAPKATPATFNIDGMT